MTRSEKRWEALAENLEVEWSPAETDERLRSLKALRHARAQARRRRFVAGGVIAGAAATVLVYFGAFGSTPEETIASATAVETFDDRVEFGDGSRVMFESADADVVVERVDEQATVVNLMRGRSRFEVTRSDERTFSVIVGDVRVTVLGTVFTVTREADARVRVQVERGRVQVESGGAAVELAAGNAGVFGGERSEAEPRGPEPDVEVTPVEATSEQPDPVEDTAEVAEPETPSPPRPAGPSWRSFAEEGDFERAHSLLETQGHGNSVADLLLAADVYRFSGQPARAASTLRTLLGRYPRDARAPLASFTLGRIELEQRGRPREAARAFAEARRLRPRGSLAEDALAREVQSWASAGDRGRAAAAATQYLELYPNGRRREAVERYGGL
ncbi:MAG: FecR domain-containing protein [Myxococcota bacterium]